MKSKLKAPRAERLTLNYDNLPSRFALKFILRRYSKDILLPAQLRRTKAERAADVNLPDLVGPAGICRHYVSAFFSIFGIIGHNPSMKGCIWGI
jgi:hypothetical protein